VIIISTNAETLDGLQAYLRAAGVTARGTRSLEAFAESAPSDLLAFVLFPDDFPWEEVVSAIAELTQRRHPALPVLVTAHPKRFEELMLGERIVVVARPVWGYQILDAIRAHDEKAGRRPPSPLAQRGDPA
jgi:hypothetical protein